MPQFGADELLVRHDAVGLCFSDVKVIRAGAEHPRIYRDMMVDPVVLGHEVTLTIVGVGIGLADRYQVGDRFIVQADIYIDGVSYAYGYETQGGLSQYSVVGERVLDADHGVHLIPIQSSMGYAESALTEPWTCVNTAYRLQYRTGLKKGGTTWIIGSGGNQDREYAISAGFDASSHPARLLTTNVPPDFSAWLHVQAADLQVSVLMVDDVANPPVEQIDDIVMLDPEPSLIETVSARLAPFGIAAIVADTPLPRKVKVDVGRVHYNRWLYVGGPGPDISKVYKGVPVRPTLQADGRVWFVGAGGPMGQMHVQRALQSSNPPRTVFCTARSERRLRIVESIYAADAAKQGIEFICASREDEKVYRDALDRAGAAGFNDIMVLAPDPGAISEAGDYIAPRGVMNVFAGVARGTMAELNLNDVYLNDARVIGHSGLTTEDMEITLAAVESGRLTPSRLVAAIGSLNAARKGLQAVSDAVFPGKIVIYPHVKEFPLTVLPELQDTLPTVYAQLKDGREWTTEAEKEFLRLMLQ
jgi:threonine dehydrogenase-like Zn-dependent dehydrogenase